jgi:superfamily II DNA or RNA helicase
LLTPRPYQLEGRDFLARTRIGLLADEMRVGKTSQAIMAAAKLGARRITVLTGPAIAAPMWRTQFPIWWQVEQPTAQIMPRVTSMSMSKALLMQNELLADTQDVTIVDECHFAGNPDAARTKLIYGKDGLVWKSGALWALSGTPAPKHAGSLWPILKAAGVVGMGYDDFLKRYCRIDWASQRPVGTREEHIPELRALWQLIGLRRTRKQVAPDMPDIGFDFLQIDPEKKVDLPMDPKCDDATLLNWLERNDALNRDDRIAVAMAKVPALLEEVEFALGNGLLRQTVIFGWHLEPLKKVTASLKAMGFKVEMLYGETSEAKRIEIEQRVQLGLLDAVVGQIRACGTAISLPVKHGYFLELDWVPANNAQAAARLVVVGDNEPVTLDVCTVPGSIDDRVQKVLLQRVRELSKLF